MELERILITELRYFGDVLLTTPLIGFLRKKYPNARIDALVYHSTREMLTGNPDLDNVYTIDQKWKKMGVKKQLSAEINLLKTLKANHYDTLLHLTTHNRGMWLARILKPKRSISCPKHFGGLNFYNKSFTHMASLVLPRERHIAKFNMDHLRALGVVVPEEEVPGLKLTIPDEARAEAAKLVGGLKDYVLVHPAARFFFKCWTEERTAEMLDRLASQGEKIVITSGPSDEERTMIEKIVSLLKVAKPIVLIGKTPSMKTFAALIDDAKLLIGVDSAPAHMAAALQTPEVILFGATIPGRWRPWENNASRVVISPGRCHFCEQRGCGRCGISECMREIRVEDVMEAANELLEHRDIPDAYRKTVYGPNDRFPTYS